MLAFSAGYYGIDHLAFMMFIGAFSVHNRCTMITQLGNGFNDLFCTVRYDKQCILLILFIQNVQYLCGSILKYNGIQSLVPTKRIPAAISMMALIPSTMLKESMPFFSEK